VVPTPNENPLKKIMNDSFKAYTYFSNLVSIVIPSSYSFLRGSNNISPSSPYTLSTSLATISISSTLTYILTIHKFMILSRKCTRKHLLYSSSFIFFFFNSLSNLSKYSWTLCRNSCLTKSIIILNSLRSTSPNLCCMFVFISFQYVEQVGAF